jgi:hypothetical protein
VVQPGACPVLATNWRNGRRASTSPRERVLSQLWCEVPYQRHRAQSDSWIAARMTPVI